MKSPLSGVCLALGLISACAGVFGCSSDKNTLEKRVSEVQQELVALQNANDRLSERLMAIEMQRHSAPAAAPVEADPPATIERPPLKVVRMGPGASPSEPVEKAEAARESPEDEGPRPVIRDIGSGRRARSRAGAGGVRQNEPRAEPASGEL